MRQEYLSTIFYVPVQLNIGKRNKKQICLQITLDSRASMNFLSPRVIHQHKIPTKKLNQRIKLTNMDETLNSIGYVTRYVDLGTEIYGHKTKERFFIADLGRDNAIFGIGWLRQNKPRIDWKTERIIFDHQEKEPSLGTFTEDSELNLKKGTLSPATTPRWNKSRTESLTQSIDVPTEAEDIEENWQPLDYEELLLEFYEDLLCSEAPEPLIAQGKASSTISTDLAEAHTLKEGEKRFEELVPEEFRDFQDIFSKEKSERLPERKPYDYAIHLKEGSKPTRSKLYPLSPIERTTLREFLDEHLRKGYIRKSNQNSQRLSFSSKRKMENFDRYRIIER